MTIHHDKLAYGKLASAREDVSEERIAQMLAALSEEEDGDGEENKRDEKSEGTAK